MESTIISNTDKRSKLKDFLKESVPTGAIPVLIGLLVTGLAAYAFLSLTAHVLGPAKYVSISVLWSVIFVVGPGIFLPFQQILTHQFSYRRANNLGAGPVAYRAALIGGYLVLFLVICTWIAAPELKRYLFDGSSELVIGLAIALIGYSMMFLISGILTGSGRFGYYALGQSLDGIFRILICIALAIIGIKSAGPYGIVFGAVPVIVAIAILAPNLDLLKPGPPVDGKAFSTSLIWLILGSVGSQLLLNGSVIAFKILSTHIDQTQVGGFVAGVVIARIPLFLFGAIQSTLLPRLATHHHAGEHELFHKRIIHTSALVAIIGSVCTLGIALVGPWMLKVFFGHQFVLGRATMSILAGTISIYMLAMVAAQGLIALGKAAYSAIGWIIGSLVFVGLLFTGAPLMNRIEVAYLSGTIASLIAEYGFLWLAKSPILRQNDSTRQIETERGAS
jgi:O-antigen/teichoic acid export membrane protein